MDVKGYDFKNTGDMSLERVANMRPDIAQRLGSVRWFCQAR